LPISCTSYVGLIFGPRGAHAIRGNAPDRVVPVAELHVPVVLEILSHHHTPEAAYSVYCAVRREPAPQKRELAEELRRACAGGGAPALLLINEKVYLCTRETLIEAYKIATAPDADSPAADARRAELDIRDLTALSAADPRAAAALQAHFGAEAAEYPALTPGEFEALVQRLSREGFLTVPRGAIEFGDFRDHLPFCAQFGNSRGTVIDRYYLERFVAETRAEVSGDTLEIGGRRGNRELYGFRGATSYRAMDLKGRDLDIVGDAHDPRAVEENSLDTVVIFNVLEHCERPWEVVENIRGWLRPGGRVLAMVPNAQRVHRVPADYWRILPDAMDSLFARFTRRRLYIYGNPLTTIASFTGIAAEELTPEELDSFDANYPVACCINAEK
jgi:SAM-dependent methyltransferase